MPRNAANGLNSLMRSLGGPIGVAALIASAIPLGRRRDDRSETGAPAAPVTAGS